MSSSSQLIKETGATFTPPNLADFISDKILSYLSSNKNKLKVLDPACGEGALLSSISKKLSAKGFEFDLMGYDLNKEFLEEAKNNLTLTSNQNSFNLKHSDFLDEISPSTKQISLFNEDSSNFINNSIDLIIANPPYVRTQILGAEYAQKIAKKFNLKGRVDLYYPFLLGMTYALKENGLIGVITSNRYLSTKSGISIRKFLKENYDILEIIDLGDTKLFDAAVLPAIFIGKKKKSENNYNSRFVKIYEELNGYNGPFTSVSNIYEVIGYREDGFFDVESKKYKKTTGVIKFLNSKESSWALLSNEENKWVNKVNKSSKNFIGDLFKVRVGIKSTADKVFIKDDWDSLGDNVPEKELLKDLISQENITPWGISDDKKLKVIYPHYSKNGKKVVVDLEKYPKAKEYFLSHKEKLSGRKYLIDAGRKWYELWVPQNPSSWEKIKLVFPDISTHPRFCLDESKRIVNGNCYWIVANSPAEVDLLLLIQGVANSLLMTKYHSLMFNNKLYSGRRRYFSQYVEKYPLPDINSSYSQRIITLVKKLNSPKKSNEKELVIELEKAVAGAFNVQPIFALD